MSPRIEPRLCVILAAIALFTVAVAITWLCAVPHIRAPRSIPPPTGFGRTDTPDGREHQWN